MSKLEYASRGTQASIYSAIEEGSGISRPSSRIASKCMRIASRMRSSTSAFVAPVATQPGKSGEKADKLFGVFSMTIKYFGVMRLTNHNHCYRDPFHSCILALLKSRA